MLRWSLWSVKTSAKYLVVQMMFYLAVVSENGDCLVFIQPDVVRHVSSYIKYFWVIDVWLNFVKQCIIETFRKDEKRFAHERH